MSSADDKSSSFDRFSGVNKKQSARAFIMSAKAHLSKYTTDAEKTQHFINCLRGSAQDWYAALLMRNASSVATWTAVENLFLSTYALTKKNNAFVWSSYCNDAFIQLRQFLIQEPILRPPDVTRPFIIITDASQTGLGAVLAQLDEREQRDHAIAYISRALEKAERNYDTTDLECLAVVWAIRQFRPYILGQHFKVITDHSALKWLFKQVNPQGRKARWISTLMEHTFIIEHRPGVTNGNADALSRMHSSNISLHEQNTAQLNLARVHLQEEYVLQVRNIISFSQMVHEDPQLDVAEELELDEQKSSSSSTDGMQFRSDSLKQRFFLQQRKEPFSESIIRYLESSKTTFPPSINTEQKRIDYAKKRAQFILCEELLYYVDQHTGQRRLYVPIALRKEILSALHDDSIAGHLGVTRTVEKLRPRFYWNGMSADTHRHIDECLSCIRAKSHRTIHPNNVPLGSLPIPCQPFEFIAMDFIGPLPKTKRHKQHILVITDYLTRWAEAVALPNQQARTAASALLENVIFRHGAPKLILTDNGTNFNSELSREIFELLKSRHINTAGYHPQTDGLTERFNFTLITMLRHFVNEQQSDWDIYIPSVMFAYRSARQETTKYTPYYMLYGREPRMPIDVLLPASSYDEAFSSPRRYVDEVQRRMAIAHNAVSQRYHDIRKARESDKATETLTNLTKKLAIGQLVVKELHQRPNKLADRWSEPYQIINRFNNGRDYVIVRVTEKDKLLDHAKSEVVNVQQLFVIPNSVIGTATAPKQRKNCKSAVRRLPQATTADTAEMLIDSSVDAEATPLIHPDHMERLTPRMARDLLPYDPATMRRSSRVNKGIIERPPHFVDSQLIETEDANISDTDYA